MRSEKYTYTWRLNLTNSWKPLSHAVTLQVTLTYKAPHWGSISPNVSRRKIECCSVIHELNVKKKDLLNVFVAEVLFSSESGTVNQLHLCVVLLISIVLVLKPHDNQIYICLPQIIRYREPFYRFYIVTIINVGNYSTPFAAYKDIIILLYSPVIGNRSSLDFFSRTNMAVYFSIVSYIFLLHSLIYSFGFNDFTK